MTLEKVTDFFVCWVLLPAIPVLVIGAFIGLVLEYRPGRFDTIYDIRDREDVQNLDWRVRQQCSHQKALEYFECRTATNTHLDDIVMAARECFPVCIVVEEEN